MNGLVGSGKSTVAKEIAKAVDAVIISSDLERRKFQKRSASFSAKKIKNTVRQKYKAELKRSEKIIIDADHFRPEDRKLLKKVASQHKAKVLYVNVVCDIDIAIGRLLKLDYVKNDSWFVEASTTFKAGKNDRARAIRLRDMMRRIPHHYTWTAERGGTWTPKKSSFASIHINTSSSEEYRKQLKEAIKTIKDVV